MSWSQRMNLAIEYIETNLHGEIRIEEAAKLACCSKYHFHRMFFASFGLTFGTYIRRRRLTLAATGILNSKSSIADIALTYGYDSPNAFTRAFRQVHGINPSQLRTSSVTLSSYNRVFFPTENRGGEQMNYRIVKVPSFKVVGRSHHFDFETFSKEGSKFWKDYVGSDDYQQLLALNKGRPGGTTGAPLLSAYFPTENSETDAFLDVLCLEAIPQSPSNDFEVHTVPAATYAEFDCTYRTSMKTNRYIYGEWFAATGYERDGNKPDIAAYFPLPFRPMNEMAIRWWIPVVGSQ